jgi:arginine deiminase
MSSGGVVRRDQTGLQSMVLPLRRVAVKHAREAFVSPERIRSEWEALGYTAAPDYQAAVTEYDRFLEVLARYVPHIEYLPRDDQTSIDSIYVNDPFVVLGGGLVACRMGKAAREPEPEAALAALTQLGMPLLGRIRRPATLEGGDVVCLSDRLLAVGEGYRTNAAGITQLDAFLRGHTELVRVPLPHWHGPGAVLHLGSILSMVDEDLAVAYSRLLAVPFRKLLLELGVRLIEVPDDEFETQGCNVLALAPRLVLMIEGNEKTQRLLEQAGATVLTCTGAEIALKGSGGPTCLTRPLLRAS